MKIVIVDECELVARWVCKRTGSEYSPDMTAIGVKSNGKLVGGVMFDGYNGANIAMHVAGEHPRWLSRDFLHAVFKYPFVQLGVRRVTGIVPASNLHARRFNEGIGFTEEARLVGAHPDGDLLIYRMFHDECRWIKRGQ